MSSDAYDIYNLGLNETLDVDTDTDLRITVTRVPGGWIYVHNHTDSQTITSTFVPLSYQNG